MVVWYTHRSGSHDWGDARLGALVGCRDRPLLVHGRTVRAARLQRSVSFPWCAGMPVSAVSSAAKVSATGQRGIQYVLQMRRLPAPLVYAGVTTSRDYLV